MRAKQETGSSCLNGLAVAPSPRVVGAPWRRWGRVFAATLDEPYLGTDPLVRRREPLREPVGGGSVRRHGWNSQTAAFQAPGGSW